jgi:hypothetical protein
MYSAGCCLSQTSSFSFCNLQAAGKEDAENLCQQWLEPSQQEFGGRFSVGCTHSEMAKEQQVRVLPRLHHRRAFL